MSGYSELEVSIRSTAPVIYVKTYEESKAVNTVKELIKDRNSRLTNNSNPIIIYEWSLPTGLVNSISKVKVESVETPVALLNYIASHTTNSLFILKDFQRLLRNTPDAIIVVRVFRELIDNLTKFDGFKRIVLTGTSWESIPEDIEKQITVVEHEYPTIDELLKTIVNMCETICKNAPGKAPDIESLLENREQMVKVAQAALGLTTHEASIVLSKSLVTTKNLDPNIVAENKAALIKKSGILEYFSVSKGLESVGGLEYLKEWLKLRSLAFTEEALAFRLPPPKGLLVIGIPGTGKSLIAKATSRAWGVPTLRLDVGALFGKYVGESEANMRKAITLAESISPCILWVDQAGSR